MRIVPVLALAAAHATAILAAPEERSRLQLHGFLLAALGVRLGEEAPAGADEGSLPLGEMRLRLDGSLATPSSRTRLFLRGDVHQDAVVGGVRGDVREAYLAQSVGGTEIGVGRQIVTWGIGDLFFVGDVFPKDWESFFAGRPMEYLKLGVDGARGRVRLGAVALDVLAIPWFTADRLPSADRFVLFDPLGGAPRNEEEPQPGVTATEWAMRLSHRAGTFSLAWHVYRGYFRAPSYRVGGEPPRARGTYPELTVVAVALERPLTAGLLGIEAGYYDSRRDRQGDDPAVPNSQARALVVYQIQPAGDLNLSFQLYAERMARYGAYARALLPGMAAQEETSSVASARLTWPLRYGTWKLSAFAAWGLAEGDSLINPEVSHCVADDLCITLGAHLLGGPPDAAPFGWMARNDNVYANVRFDF